MFAKKYQNFPNLMFAKKYQSLNLTRKDRYHFTFVQETNSSAQNN